MGDIAVRVENLGKSYQISHNQGRSKYRTLQDEIIGLVRRPFQKAEGSRETVWALQDISFELKKGEALGIIGRNGAGKSTLLKVLSRITRPTTGHADVYGRVGSLLEVGTGFHPELTGRENIFLNGAVLGMTRRDIQRRFDEIVAFADVEKYLDTPVKRYSSGMYMRLAFSVAAHLEPEILVVDEVLAVGDAEFQKKCLGRMGDLSYEGRTILFVSHNMVALENLCSKGLLLNQGELVKIGDIAEVIEQYSTKTIYQISSLPLLDRVDRQGTGDIKITDFHLEDINGCKVERVQSGQDCIFCFTYKCREGQMPKWVSFGFAVFDSQGHPLFRNSTEVTNSDFETVPAQGTFKCLLPCLPLIGGDYMIGILVTAAGTVADYINEAARFTVEDGDYFGTGRVERHSPFLVKHSWQLAINS